MRGSRKHPFTRQDWQNEVHAYRALVRTHGLKPGFDRLMSPAFSTTTPFEATAHDIGTLASVKDFFVFRTSIIFCGIPSVTLEGRPRDWRDLRRRCERLSDYGLGWWEDDLLPVLDQFVAASRGHADTTFWQGLYRMPVKDPSGKKIIRHCGYSPNGTSGWVTVFYPYLKRQPNPRLHDNDPSAYIKEDDLLTSQVTFTLTLEYREALPVFTETWSIWAGIAGVSQHPVTRALRPEICWGVIQQPGENRLTLNPLDTVLRATGIGWLGLWDVPAAVPGLVSLHADGNNFRSLPQEVIAMPRLDSLFASHNHLREGGYYLPFSEIPAQRYWPGSVEPDGTLSEPHLAFTEAGYEMPGPTPTSLRYADLSHNELDSNFLASLALWQPRHPDTLWVDLQHNAIKALPTQLWNIQYPIILNLTGNPLEAVWPPVKPLPPNIRAIWQPAVAASAPTPCIWPALDECPIDDANDTRVPVPAEEILEEED